MSAEMTSQAIIERTLAAMGYEVVDIERAHDGLLRVYIDSPDGIRLDDCEKASRQLSHVLAVEDVDYTRLEVSSPGLDRPLKKPADFERFAGSEITLRLRKAFEGRRNFDGLLTVEDDGRYGLELIERDTQASRQARRGRGGSAAATAARSTAVAKPERTRAAAAVPAAAEEDRSRKLVFSLDEIERARLVPKLKFQERRK